MKIQCHFKEKNNKIKSYRLPDIEWIKKDKEEVVYDLIPKSLEWSIKVIGKTESGKKTFVSAFLKFLIRYTVDIENIYLLSPTTNQIGWDKVRNNTKHINNINEIVDVNNYVIVCNDMQIQLKEHKILTEMILNKGHRNLGIIKCEQYTQITDVVQKVDADILY